MKRRETMMMKATAVALSCATTVTPLFAAGSRGGAAQPPLHAADFSVFANDTALELFLLVGQSNMKGRGLIDPKPVTNKRNLFFHPKQQQWYVSRDPFIACTIGSFIHPHKRFTRSREINDILLRLPSKRQHTACIDARDLKVTTGDKLHYCKDAQIEIGKRFAAAYLKLSNLDYSRTVHVSLQPVMNQHLVKRTTDHTDNTDNRRRSRRNPCHQCNPWLNSLCLDFSQNRDQ